MFCIVCLFDLICSFKCKWSWSIHSVFICSYVCWDVVFLYGFVGDNELFIHNIIALYSDLRI